MVEGKPTAPGVGNVSSLGIDSFASREGGVTDRETGVQVELGPL